MDLMEPAAVRRFVARHSLVMAFVLSLLVHGGLYGGWRLGKHFKWWEHQATWLMDWKKKLHPKPLQPALAAANVEPVQREIPMTFVEVDPALAVPEPPKDAKYYSSQSSRAANPDPVMDTVVPKIDGRQTQVPRTEDVPKPAPQPLQPAPQVEPEPKPLPPKPKGGEIPGDLAKATPEKSQKPPTDGKVDVGVGSAPIVQKERPRTLAAARQQKGLVGQKMREDGGVSNHGRAALSVARTPFGSYDAALVAAVQQRWYDLLDSTSFAQRSGRVVIEFRLYYDGRITDMKIDGNEVGEILGTLCQRAVLDPSPFAQWPDDMRRAVGKNYRDVLFTFFYN